MNLYLLKDYNNYFNRKIRVHSTLNDYLTAVGGTGNYFLLANTNFNPNDGVSTEHVVGSGTLPFDYEWNPDYVVATNASGDIISRWYVTEFTRTMSNQYRMALKRDSVVDKLDIVKNADTYIEKATLNEYDPLIVNSEGLSFNQIKTNEYLLKDKTKVPWVIVYLAQKRDDQTQWNDIEAKYKPDNITSLPVIEDDPLMSSLFISGGVLVQSKTIKAIRDFTTIRFNGQPSFYEQYAYGINTNEGYFNVIFSNTPITGYPNMLQGYSGYIDAFISNFSNNMNPKYEDFRLRVKNEAGADIRLYEQYQEPVLNKFWYSRTTGKVYKTTSSSIESIETKSITSGSLFTLLKNTFDNTNPSSIITGNYQFELMYNLKTTTYRLTENAVDIIKVSQINTDANHCIDVPYDILAFPAMDILVKQSSSPDLYFNCEGEVSLAFARQLAIDKGSFVYDVQMLPFCPIDSGMIQNGTIDATKGVDHVDYEFIIDKDNSNKVGIILFATKSSLSFNIDKISEGDIYYDVSDILQIDNRKLENECDMWRLVSPNFQGQFEFNIAKMIPLNEKSISKFNVDIMYKPISPFIMIQPDFGFLYGRDFNDSRGLICGGDFSISTLSDAWKQYELNNKNYQNMFDRQIQNMEVNRAIAREQEQWNIINSSVGIGVNTLMGTGLGLITGKNPVGTISGAITGAIKGGMGLAGAIKQTEWAERSYQENRSYTTDMFNMQLDNIKALPQSLTKVSALSNNYKYYPVLEYYTCTEIEKNALEKKLKYNGMSVGRIDKIVNYLSSTETRFIKGQVIHLNDISEDSHLANDIYNEVLKGLFFMPEGE